MKKIVSMKEKLFLYNYMLEVYGKKLVINNVRLSKVYDRAKTLNTK